MQYQFSIKDFDEMQNIIVGLRKIRADYKIPQK